jgi:AcrR family transcriptional regulator
MYGHRGRSVKKFLIDHYANATKRENPGMSGEIPLKTKGQSHKIVNIMKKPPRQAAAAAAVATPPKPRGRPRSFDREAALDAAMQVFWEKGFEGASINDLTAAMGVNPPSLYAAFGDKESLFLATIEHYAASRSDQVCPNHPTAKKAIEAYLRFKADILTGSGHPRGCMLMVAFFTAANASPKLQQVLAMKRAQAREFLKERIKRGIRDGDVPAGTDAEELADFYTAIVGGLAQQARDGATPRSLLATVERALTLFPEP